MDGERLNPIEIIWNGFPAASGEPRLAHSPTVVYAGRLVPEKGVDVLLQAFSHVVETISDAKLIVTGSGAERLGLEEMTAALGITSSVTFSGHLPKKEMERIFAGAWVQVVPSIWAEPFGNVAAEGMMRGTAVVASRTGGIPEFIKDGENGFLFPPGDAKALAATLYRLLSNRDLAEQLGRAGQEFAMANLTIERCVDNILGVYEKIRGHS